MFSEKPKFSFRTVFMPRREHVISLEFSVIHNYIDIHFATRLSSRGCSRAVGTSYRSWESPAIVYNLSGLTAKRQKVPHSLQPSSNR